MQPGVKLDLRHFEDGYVVTAADVAAELERIGHALRPLDIVVANTRAGSGSRDLPAADRAGGHRASLAPVPIQ